MSVYHPIKAQLWAFKKDNSGRLEVNTGNSRNSSHAHVDIDIHALKKQQTWNELLSLVDILLWPERCEI